ncbi:serine palmitoyltransferase small subunit A [Thrips palmi]|uniref:Serine palmitoyltransferase small subunit A n=1 Tax=Thrips palmi TaxID=161013 RepID=A0A6P8YSG6_THRPL|nr:serine palmitoyltransferase small subunit A [Thrips palmi]
MLKFFERLSNFLSYWYFRYLMVTELYMVETWEQRVTNTAFMLLFVVLSYFNCVYLLNYTASIAKYLVDEVPFSSVT